MGKNWDYSKAKGREMRLNAELNFKQLGTPVPIKPPLFSHCGTMQSYFERAWNGVNQCDIHIHLNQSNLGQSKVPSVTEQLSQLRSLLACHSL